MAEQFTSQALPLLSPSVTTKAVALSTWSFLSVAFLAKMLDVARLTWESGLGSCNSDSQRMFEAEYMKLDSAHVSAGVQADPYAAGGLWGSTSTSIQLPLIAST